MSPVEEQQIESFRWTFAREQPIVGKIQSAPVDTGELHLHIELITEMMRVPVRFCFCFSRVFFF